MGPRSGSIMPIQARLSDYASQQVGVVRASRRVAQAGQHREDAKDQGQQAAGGSSRSRLVPLVRC